MSINSPVASVVFGSITPLQGDIIDLQIHLGCSNEISSFDCLLQNFDKKYSPGGTYPINVGVDGSISLGRGANCPLVLTLRVEEIEPLSTATENYIRVRGRCWGKRLFRRLVTKSYDNVKGEAVVKDIIDNYTDLSHVRNSVELIEDTDTTYTRLDYEDTPIFDIIKYIADTADKAGAIGYDFRIASDGKFEFFPKNSKTSSVSLSERLEVSEYAKNIHRIRNKITVYGAAEKTNPSNEDSWTDGTADQSQSDLVEDSHLQRTYQLISTLSFTPSASQKIALKKVQLDVKMDASGTHAGQYKVTYQKGSGVETDFVTDQSFTNTTYTTKEHTCAINGDFGEQITIRFYTKISAGPYDGELVSSKNYYMIYDLLTYDWYPDQSDIGITLDTTDKQQGTASVKVSATAVTWAGTTLTLADADIINGNKFANINVKVKLGSNYKGSGKIYLYSTQTPPDNLVFQPINLTVGQWQNLSFAVGRKNRTQWFGNPTTFNWTQIKKIRLVFDLVGTSSGDFLFDHMFFGGGRWEATREDSASQTNYGLREKVETDEELHSDAECDYRAKALLDFLKGPIETLKVRSEVVDYGATPILAGDKIHVTIPNENIDSDYRIISVEYKASGRDQTLEVELELAKEPQFLADFIYGFRKSIQKLDKYKASIATSGVSSSGGGGGGGEGGEDHNILSTTHLDSLPGSVAIGDLIIGNNTPKWSRLALGSANAILKVISGLPAWGSVAHSELTGVTSDQHHAKIHNLAHVDHPDVSIASPTNGQMLIYNSALGKWENLDPNVTIVGDNVGLAKEAGNLASIKAKTDNLDVLLSTRARGHFYDRNPTAINQFYSGSLAAHGVTVRWTYTVPANRKAMFGIVFNALSETVTTSGKQTVACQTYNSLPWKILLTYLSWMEVVVIDLCFSSFYILTMVYSSQKNQKAGIIE